MVFHIEPKWSGKLTAANRLWVWLWLESNSAHEFRTISIGSHDKIYIINYKLWRAELNVTAASQSVGLHTEVHTHFISQHTELPVKQVDASIDVYWKRGKTTAWI